MTEGFDIPIMPSLAQKGDGTSPSNVGGRSSSGSAFFVEPLATIRRSLTKRVTDDSSSEPPSVRVPGTEGASRAYEVYLAEELTLKWNTIIDAGTPRRAAFASLSNEAGALPRQGSCCLYKFPEVVDCTDGQGLAKHPGLEGVNALTYLLTYLASNTNVLVDVPDAVGAFPVHALMVRNTSESLQCAFDILESAPAMLKLRHATGKPYAGETLLHIAAANSREEVLLQLIELGVAKLAKEDLKGLLLAQATGAFFRSTPMSQYGGTVLGYACSFDLRKVVVALLNTGHVSLDSLEDACVVSGFLPLHAAVATRQLGMYDFLTTGLEQRLRANPTARTRPGMPRGDGRLDNVNLNPLQLAARLGDQAAVQHILKTQVQVLWVWGPVTQFALALHGIDSASSRGASDVMELIVRDDAQRRTTEMLLDSFMNGFLFSLYEQKWRLFGRKLYTVRLLLLSPTVGFLLYQAFTLKADPTQLPEVRWVSYILLVLATVLLMVQIRLGIL